MPGDRKLSKSQKNTLNKSNATKKNTNKNRANGCSRVKKGSKGTSACGNWKNNPKRRTKARNNSPKKSNDKSKDESKKIGGLEITVSKDENQNKGLSQILSGGKALPKLRAKLPSIKLGRRDKSLNIDEESNWGQHLDDSFSA